jgi:hypothetical protein
MQPKGQSLNTLERYYIYKHKKMGEILDEFQYDTHNPIFELIIIIIIIFFFFALCTNP